MADIIPGGAMKISKYIQSGRLDDLRARRAAMVEDRDRYRSSKDAAWKQYYEAESVVLDPIREYVEHGLSQFSLLDIDVTVQLTFGDLLQVEVSCEGSDNALKWRWSARLEKDGTIKSDSSSWSGLSATTAEEIEQLRQSVDAIEWLINVDWKSVLSVELPDVEDFIDDSLTAPSETELQDLDNQILEEELREAVGNNVLIAGESNGTIYNKGLAGYYLLIAETPKQYTVSFIPERYLNGDRPYDEVVEEFGSSYSEYNIRKSTFMQFIKKPLELFEF